VLLRAAHDVADLGPVLQPDRDPVAGRSSGSRAKTAGPKRESRCPARTAGPGRPGRALTSTQPASVGWDGGRTTPAASSWSRPSGTSRSMAGTESETGAGIDAAGSATAAGGATTGRTEGTHSRPSAEARARPMHPTAASSSPARTQSPRPELPAGGPGGQPAAGRRLPVPVLPGRGRRGRSRAHRGAGPHRDSCPARRRARSASWAAPRGRALRPAAPRSASSSAPARPASRHRWPPRRRGPARRRPGRGPPARRGLPRGRGARTPCRSCGWPGRPAATSRRSRR
jgi:hypothetical protein